MVTDGFNYNMHQHRHNWDVTVQIRQQTTEATRSKSSRCEFWNVSCISCCFNSGNKMNVSAVWRSFKGSVPVELYVTFNDSSLIFAIVSATALLLWRLHGNSLKMLCCSTWLLCLFVMYGIANVEHPPTSVCRVTVFLISVYIGSIMCTESWGWMQMSSWYVETK